MESVCLFPAPQSAGSRRHRDLHRSGSSSVCSPPTSRPSTRWNSTSSTVCSRPVHDLLVRHRPARARHPQPRHVRRPALAARGRARHHRRRRHRHHPGRRFRLSRRLDRRVRDALDRGLHGLPDHHPGHGRCRGAGPSLANAIVAMVVVWWPNYARVVRSLVIGVKSQEYVEAAYSIGAPRHRVLGRTVLPNCLAPAVVLATIDLGNAILVFAGLSFLGLGPEPSTPEWGRMIADGIEYFDQWWMAAFAGACHLHRGDCVQFRGRRHPRCVGPTPAQEYLTAPVTLNDANGSRMNTSQTALHNVPHTRRINMIDFAKRLQAVQAAMTQTRHRPALPQRFRQPHLSHRHRARRTQLRQHHVSRRMAHRRLAAPGGRAHPHPAAHDGRIPYGRRHRLRHPCAARRRRSLADGA